MATTLKLPVELKERIAKVVQDTGQTAHGFMVDAIRKQTESAEKRREFLAAALTAREEYERTGAGYAMEDVHAYIRAKAQGKKPKRPSARRWRA